LRLYFIPNRTLDAVDLLADIAGIIIFSVITTLIANIYIKE